VALYRDLIALRARDSVFREQRPRCLDGAVIAPEAFVLRFFGRKRRRPACLRQLRPRSQLRAIAEPLLAPPHRRSWRILWSSEDPKYGGGGTAAFETEAGLHIPATPHWCWSRGTLSYPPELRIIASRDLGEARNACFQDQVDGRGVERAALRLVGIGGRGADAGGRLEETAAGNPAAACRVGAHRQHQPTRQ
jgi:hypothetical protein